VTANRAGMPEPAGPAPLITPPAAPRWARGLDVLVIVLALLAIFVTLAGRTLLLKIGEIPLPSAPQLLFAIAACLAIRHAAHPRPGFAASLARWRAWVHERPAVEAAARAFVFTRPMVFLVAYFAVVTIGFPARVGFTLSQDPLGNLPARFDAGWYGQIARHGYTWTPRFERQQSIAFFPAMPMLTRPVGSVLAANHPLLSGDQRLLRMLWAGVVVSLVAFACGLVYLSRLSTLLAGPAAGASAPLLLAAYPFAVFFSAPYTESLFLLASAGAFYHFHQRQWIRASLWGLIVGLTRPNGMLVSAALAVLGAQQLYRHWRMAGGPWSPADWLRAATRPLATAAMPGIGMLIYTVYIYSLTGIWFAWMRTQEAWGREWGIRPFAQGWEWLTTEGLVQVSQGVPFDTLNSMAAVFTIAMTWLVFRRLGPAYGLFMILNLVPPLFSGGALSLGRMTSTLFPMFIALAATLRPAAVPGWVASFAVFQGLVAALFFTWREIF
jgi:hypothetical protein